MDSMIFSTVFIMQLTIWLFLSLTRIGKIISGVWGSITLLWFLITFLYPSYLEGLKISTSGNLGAIADFIEMYITNLINFLIQLVVPPWMGLLIGSKLSSNNSKMDWRIAW